jgi:hypothetical protein
MAVSASYRKKSGRPAAEDYVNPLYLHSMSKVVAALNTTFPNLLVSASLVAHQLLDFITLMDVSCVHLFLMSVFVHCIMHLNYTMCRSSLVWGVILTQAR